MVLKIAFELKEKEKKREKKTPHPFLESGLEGLASLSP